ncbi:MAG: alpha/beta hydrolase [Bdellovibrionaceae bacterium]|nr:alpha/beta hydrolase [Pseudobdellovibrionaceae bacterium]
MRKLFLPLAGMLFVLSLLNIMLPFDLITWRLSVVTKEYGHFFFLLGAFFALMSWRDKDIPSVLLFAFASFFFARPMMMAWSGESAWRREFAQTLGEEKPLPPLLSLKTLFFGRGLLSAPYERLVYAKSDGEDLHLDFYRATPAPSGPVPWVLVLHGGGWEGGSSDQLPELNWHLARQGYAVISMSYRFSPKHPWPAQREDALAALHYVREHAAGMGLDLNRWFVLGRSAGAQIAGVLAYTLKDPGLRGYISFYPPTDLTFGYEVGEENDLLASRSLVRRFLKGSPQENAPNYQSSSVIEALANHPVPTLLLHGRTDLLTWFKHSERLALRLQALNVPYAYVDYPWATHGFDYNLNGPAGQISTTLIDSFLQRFSR